MEKFTWILIEESLENKSILEKIIIKSTEIEKVTQGHKTPWVKNWTMHTIEIDEENIDNISEEISKWLDSKHNWYADFKNSKVHYIIFSNKVFKINRNKKEEYDEATAYWISIWIPDYQVDFSPHIQKWER